VRVHSPGHLASKQQSVVADAELLDMGVHSFEYEVVGRHNPVGVRRLWGNQPRRSVSCLAVDANSTPEELDSVDGQPSSFGCSESKSGAEDYRQTKVGLCYPGESLYLVDGQRLYRAVSAFGRFTPANGLRDITPSATACRNTDDTAVTFTLTVEGAKVCPRRATNPQGRPGAGRHRCHVCDVGGARSLALATSEPSIMG
jgi:hypothetical protein